MRFSPLPTVTSFVVLLAVALVVAWMIWGSLNDPESLWAPGKLSRYHADVAACKNCHQPFQGTTAQRCIACHGEKYFATQSNANVSEAHRNVIREEKSCTACHTEHRGPLAQITVGALLNPHGDFVFRATGTHSCGACHRFSADFETRPQLLNNAIVAHLLHEGEGAHRPGTMSRCLACHADGHRAIESEHEAAD